MTTNSKAQKRIGAASRFAFTKNGELRPHAQTLLGRALSVQRPVVLAYIRSVRRRHPHATPGEIAEILRTHYVNLTTGGGAAVGATAVVPGLGTGAALGLAAVETGGFLEMSALYAQSLAELHDLQVKDPARANALVMGLMLGSTGKDLVRQFSQQADGGPTVHSNFGSLVTRQLPSVVIDPLVRKLRKKLIRTYAARTGGSVVGRALPFGVGAVVGGVANRMMASTVVKNAHTAFGDMPSHFPADLDPASSSALKDADLMAGLRHLMTARKRRNDIQGETVDQLGLPEVDETDDAGAPDAADRTESAPEVPKTWRPDVRL